MNVIPAARSYMGICNFQSDTVSRTATFENPIQNHGEVYDVAHHASNVLLAVMRETEPLAILLRVYSPSSIYIVNPISELVRGSVPVGTISNSIRQYLRILRDTPTSAMRRQLARLVL